MLTVSNHDICHPPAPVRRQSTRPVIVDRRPITPPESPPQTPASPPRNVHFQPVTCVSRPPNQVENYSLWYFEDHVYQCRHCHISRDKYNPAIRLCSRGRALSADVRVNVYSDQGEIYSKYGERSPNGTRRVRIELPNQYWRVKAMLRACEKSAQDTSASSTVAVHNGHPGRERRDSVMGDSQRKRRDSVMGDSDRKNSRERNPRHADDSDRVRHQSRSHSRSRSRSQDDEAERRRYEREYARSRGNGEERQTRYIHHYYPRAEETPSRSERGRRVIVVEIRGSKDDADRRTRRTSSRD